MYIPFFADGTWYSPENPLIIAELGTSHGGELSKAKEMAAEAAKAGAGCIKFQMVFADEILHPTTGEVSLPGGKIRLYDRFKQLEKPRKFYAEIKEHVESLGLLFLCTPFGLKSAKILRELQPKIVKIASPELNFTALLQEVSSWNLPVLLSTGVSTLGDIEKAVIGIRDQGLGIREKKGIRDQGSGIRNCCSNCDDNPSIYSDSSNYAPKSPVPSPQSPSDPRSPVPGPRSPSSPHSPLPIPHSPILLHCVTSYPAPETDYNLRVLRGLAAVFGVSVGVSDHSLDPELVPALAITQGASVIEKHFCLSRSDPGLDDPIALPPHEFSRMTAAVRRTAEAGPEEALAVLTRERGVEIVEAILGSGVKTLAPSEKENYSRTNRSIHALRDIQTGETIKAKDFAVLRTEKILRPGLPPSMTDQVCGRTARQFIPAGEGIRFEDV